MNKAAINEGNFTASEADMGYGQLFGILLRRRFWFLGVLAVALLAATGLGLTRKPAYQSSMQLLVEPNYKDKQLNVGLEKASSDSSVDDYATQINLMRSSQLVKKAINSLQATYPELSVDSVQNSLTLTQVVEKIGGNQNRTKIFSVKYVADDPVKAQKVLLALQKVYREYNLQQQKLRLDEGLEFLNRQVPEARRKVAAAEGALEQFRKQQNVIDPSQQADTMVASLEQVQRERDSLRAEFEQNLAQYRTIQQRLGYSLDESLIAARLSQSSRYQNLLDSLQTTDLSLAQQRSVYKDSDPTIQTLQDKRSNELSLLQEEIGRILGGMSAQVGSSAEALRSAGQLGSTDLDLVNQLVTTRTTLAGLQARDESLTQTQQKLVNELNQFPSLIAEYERLQPEVALNRATLQKLLEVRQEVGIELARGGFNWQLVEPPQEGSSIGLSFSKYVLLGGVLGVLLGGVAAFAREAMDNAVHTSEQLQQSTALPLLGTIPDLSPSRVNRFSLLMRQSDAGDSTSISSMFNSPIFQESLNLIYKNIRLQHPTVKSLVITSAVAGEGKTTLALGLALSAARAHQRVLLIDADLRRPSLHERLNLPNHTGLASILAGEVDRAQRREISLGNATIDVITAGPATMDPVKLLSSPDLKKLIASAEHRYDWIVLDAPPAVGLVDAVQIGSCCQGVVMIERISRVTQADLTQAVMVLKPLNVMGIVANGAGELKSPYPLPYASTGGQNGNHVSLQPLNRS